MTNNTIISINEKLCAGCGTCSALCPNECIILAIDLQKGTYVPKIDDKICKNCGICLKVCPAYNTNFKELNLDIFNKKPDNYFIGTYSNCYLGHSTNIDIRYNSSSGGMITQLLIFALDEGIIDGALVTRMKKDNPLEPEPFIARTKNEILEASTSKYCPVPTNVALKELLKFKGERFAVVGLPCHINGIRKAEQINKKLKDMIVLHFGIFCSHTESFKSTDHLLLSLGLDKNNVKQISYRGNGWPGKIHIELNTGKKISISNQNSFWNTIFNGLFLTPISCLYCNDLTAELSDISFGDPWLKEIMSKEKNGKSVLISRTKNGDKLLKLSVNKHFIEISPIKSKQVIESQKKYLHFKKLNINERFKIIGIFDKKLTNNANNMKVSPLNKVLALVALFNNAYGTKFEALLKYVPNRILETYLFGYSLLYSETIKRDSEWFNEKKHLNILILNAHWNNRGDESAIRSMLESLEYSLPVKKINIMVSPDDINFISFKNVTRLKLYPFYLKKKVSTILSLFIDMILITLSLGNLSITKEGKTFIEAVSLADVILYAPGGPMIGDTHGGKYGLNEFYYLYRLMIPIIKKKNIFFYAPSVGPFNNRIKNIFRKIILSKVNKIIVREEISSAYLKNQLGLKSYITLDSAIQNDIQESYLDRYDSSLLLERLKVDKYIGLIVTDLKWHPKYGKNKLLQDKIKKTISQSVNLLIAKGYKILLIPQLIDDDNEKVLIEYVQKLNKVNIIVLDSELDSYAQQIIISKLYCVISMRYHPCIFAIKNNIPVVAIFYEHKMEGFMEKADLSELTLNIEEVSSEKIIEKFELVEKNYGLIKSKLSTKSLELKESSKNTTKIIKDELINLGLI